MNNFISIFFIIAFFSSGISQNKEFSLNWVDDAPVPLAEGYNYESTLDGVFTFYKTFEIKTVDYSAAKVVNVLYKNVDSSNLGSLNTNTISSSFSYQIFQRNAFGKKLNIVSFTPIIKDGNGYKKVMSFSLIEGDVNISSSNISFKSLNNAETEVVTSVLATGEWFKFKIDTTGVYRITPQFLSSLGMNLNGVDPNTIKIYGNGGQHLPYLNSDNDSFDIKENPIQLFGGEDGVFSGNDYLLFYGRGTREFVAEDASHINPYTDDAYYYITYGGEFSERIANDSRVLNPPTQTINSYTHYSFYEEDQLNLGNMGRRWFGDKFDNFNSSKDYNFELPDLAENGAVVVRVAFAAIFGTSPNVLVSLSDNTGVKDTGSLSFGTIGNNSTFNSSLLSISASTLGVGIEDDEAFIGNDLQVQLNFQQGADIASEGFLDFITVEAESILQSQNKQFGFETNINIGEVGEYLISNASSISSVWNVTDPFLITKNDNNGADQFSFSEEMDSIQKIVVLDEDDFYTPQTVSNSRVANQDLKSTVLINANNEVEPVDYLILTNGTFLSAGSRLANFRSQQNGYNVKVVDIQNIYNEFSTSSQDIVAIRNFVKYVYDNSIINEGEESNLKYVCIIGDGSFDLKDRIPNNNNHVPLYHSTESSSVANSFCTDDFYTLMDANEGSNLIADKMDISIGRILVRDASEANTMIDKIINFYDRDTFGDWRNSLLFISDDVDEDTDSELQEVIIEVSEVIEETIPRANIKLLITDAFEQESTSAGERYPVASRQFQDFFTQGLSFVDYFGHGGEDGITGEFIFTSENAQSLTNQDRLPVFSTLTCELTRFDNPNRETAGEFMYWNKIGGAIGLLSTTRQLFLSVGTDLNEILVDELFDENSLNRSIGDVLRRVKDLESGANARTVFCIGDPAIEIALPKPDVQLTGIFDEAGNQITGAVRALDKITIEGKVVNEFGDDLTNYNGEATISIFDKDVERTTLANDGIRDSAGEIITVDFTESGSLVFKGLATVSNGNFSMDLLLPKNVQLEEGEGRISFYVARNNENDDQSGAEKILIGGLNESAAKDTTPPVIELFLNDENFFSGQVVGSSPIVYAKLTDESGINTAGGVGHDIQIIIDGNEADPIIANEFYVTNVDDFTSGKLNYQLNNLEPGEHTLQLRVSDAFNNPSIQEITFIVNDNQNFVLTNVLNYPNPFTSYTEFWFSHTSISNDTLEVSVQIMTISGKIVTTKHITLSGETSYRSSITWDAKDDFGNKLGKGVYLYKIIAKSTLTNNTATKIEKLVLL